MEHNDIPSGPLFTLADPIPKSISRVVPKTAKRLGYELVAVCQHCIDGLIAHTDRDPWIHQNDGSSACQPGRRRPTRKEV